MGFRILNNGTDLGEMIVLGEHVLNHPELQEWFDDIIVPHVVSGRQYKGDTLFGRLRLAKILLQMPTQKHLVTVEQARFILQCKLKGESLYSAVHYPMDKTIG